MTIAEKPLLISSYPTLHAGMLFPFGGAAAATYPFNQPSTRYYYLARNAIWAMAKLWKLGGEEILFPAYCHGVELETLLAAGVDPTYYPVDRNMRVDVDRVVSMITPKTRAVYVIHYLGMPGPAAALAQVCQERGIRLIEDCALALLSRDGERPLGSIGDAGIFCLYKTLAVPNGGALVVRDPGSGEWPATRTPTATSTLAYTASALWRQLQFNSKGGPVHSMLQFARGVARARSEKLGVVPVGDNFLNPDTVDLSMSNVCRWILGRQDYAGIVERRRRNYLHLLRRLRGVADCVFPELPEGVCPLFFPIRTQNKMAVHGKLQAAGVDAVNFWSFQPPSIEKGTFPVVDELRQTIIELPCHQDVTQEVADGIADQVEKLRSEL